MKTYYRFLFVDTLEILEFDTEMVSFKAAERRARAWAKDSESAYEYKGVVSH